MSGLIEPEDVPQEILEAVERLLIEIEGRSLVAPPHGSESLAERVTATAVVLMSMYGEDLWVSITDHHPDDPNVSTFADSLRNMPPMPLFATGYEMGWKVLAETIKTTHPDLALGEWLDECVEIVELAGPPNEWKDA